MSKERTLVIIKPDGVRKGIAREILKRYVDAGLNVESLHSHKMNAEEAERFYEEHAGKPYFEGLVLAMSSGPMTVVILSGENAIKIVREMNGATNPKEAAIGTIRRDFPSAGGPFNIVHGSDSAESAEREIKVIFKRRLP